jgi:hypothetical protein
MNMSPDFELRTNAGVRVLDRLEPCLRFAEA